MSLCRVVFSGIRNFRIRKDLLFDRVLASQLQNINLNQKRDFRKAYGSFLKCMKGRRKLAGPEKERKRSDFYEWNYNAELYAFNKRLQENMSDDHLRCAFVHESYVKMEEVSRKELDVEGVQFTLKSNYELIKLGHDVISNFLKRYLRHSYQLMPEDGICAVHDYLTSEDSLAYISTNLGTKDLIFCAEYPPDTTTLATTLEAIVGAIALSDSIARSEGFVLDFICTQLIGKDLFEVWEFDQPLEILNAILDKQNRAPAESRLIFESGRNTIEAIYHIGLYSEKKYLGKGFGETLAFAEEIAAYDALRRIFQLNETIKPLPLGETAKNIEFKLETEHQTIDEICSNNTSSKNIASA